MTMTPSAAVARIGRHLHDSEQKTDAALRASAALMTTLLDARAMPDIVPHTGQTELLRLVRAQQQLIDASTNIFRVHNGVAKLGVEHGLCDEAIPTSGLALADDVSTAQAA